MKTWGVFSKSVLVAIVFALVVFQLVCVLGRLRLR